VVDIYGTMVRGLLLSLWPTLLQGCLFATCVACSCVLVICLPNVVVVMIHVALVPSFLYCFLTSCSV